MIHEVVMGKERNAPKTVLSLEDKAFDELESMGAVREATADEVAIAGFAPVAAPAPAKVEAAAAKKPSKKELAAAAEAEKKAEDAAKAAEVQKQAEADRAAAEAAATAAAAPSVDPDDLLSNG